METQIIDCRLLEHPEPLVRVLEAVSRLQQGQKIQMIHRMKPVPLFAKLDERGMDYRVDQQDSVITVWIWHKE